MPVSEVYPVLSCQLSHVSNPGPRFVEHLQSLRLSIWGVRLSSKLKMDHSHCFKPCFDSSDYSNFDLGRLVSHLFHSFSAVGILLSCYWGVILGWFPDFNSCFINQAGLPWPQRMATSLDWLSLVYAVELSSTQHSLFRHVSKSGHWPVSYQLTHLVDSEPFSFYYHR